MLHVAIVQTCMLRKRYIKGSRSEIHRYRTRVTVKAEVGSSGPPGNSEGTQWGRKDRE